MNGLSHTTRSSLHAELIQLQDAAEEAAITKLESLDFTDPERAHSAADEALLTFIKGTGFEGIAEAYEHVVARCSWWASA
ncbi:hypothetical protein LCGC14_2837210 [marine sediment metagenome]|uniref:Uncharacterized protein n=1 Tax=marine sediment metagenome TaxID=412755 RepID=A0A0F9B3E2_9ZZZZ